MGAEEARTRRTRAGGRTRHGHDESANGWTGGRERKRRGRGGGVGGLKGARTLLSISLSRTQSACLIAAQVCRVLGSAMGSKWIPKLKHPYNLKGAQTHLCCLSASIRGAQKGIFFSI